MSKQIISETTLTPEQIATYDFKKQADNWEAVREFMFQNDITIEKMVVTEIVGRDKASSGPNGRIMVDIKLYGSDGFLWHKYENGLSQSGQNTCKFGKERFKTSDLKLSWQNWKKFGN